MTLRKRPILRLIGALIMAVFLAIPSWPQNGPETITIEQTLSADVLALMDRYGRLDGEIVYNYVVNFVVEHCSDR